MLLNALIEGATRHLFFTGKGGVGKTSTACATAVALADRGRRVLLVSTDPASNLDEVLRTPFGSTPVPVAGAKGLWAMNIDPVQAAAAYRERVVGPYRDLLPKSAVASIEEQLSGACTVEIAAFDEFTNLLAGDTAQGFDHVLFDTAPTGHTLRLLALPSAWTGFINANTLGTSCIGPLSGLKAQRDVYQAAMDALADAKSTTLVLVARPETITLLEAERTRNELQALGMFNQHLILNGIFHAVDQTDAVATAMERRSREALDDLPVGLSGLPRSEVPLLPFAPLGVDGLRSMLASGQTTQHPAIPRGPLEVPAGSVDLGALVSQIEAQGTGLVMTMGKGGVGKTTVAGLIALELVDRGHRVLLTTTDPAAHLEFVVNRSAPGLEVARINPAVETEAYRRSILETTGAALDADGRAILEEDLQSPCTEEIAVFRAFARTVADARGRFVVLDTAPTGHTLLLLDAAQAFHREVSRQASTSPPEVVELLGRLRDPGYTHVLIVTTPEATPVHEAAALQADLKRAGIEPMAWVVNQSLLAAGVRDPLLVARAAAESTLIQEVVQLSSNHTCVLAWTATPANAVRPALMSSRP